MIMRFSALVAVGVGAVALFGFRGGGGDSERVADAKAHLASLGRLSKPIWEQMQGKHTWVFGAPSKVKLVGLLTPNASANLKNMLFGGPNKDADILCKTIMVPDDASPTWNLASKLRIAYAIVDSSGYQTPPIVLNSKKQVAEPKVGDFDAAWKALPADIQKQATDEFELYRELAKHVKTDTYFVELPDGSVVEVGHPFNVEKVWNEYLMSR